MDKRILLPTDYSKNALNAIRYALELYRDVQCDFYVLNVFRVSSYTLDNMMVPESGEQFYDTAKRTSEEGMTRLMEMIRLHPDNPKHKFHTICTFNSLIEAVKGIIAKKDIDIIVMGTKGTNSSKAKIFGTNTVTLMEKIKECPVIAVPEGYSYSVPKEIVFPTDFKSDYKRKELQYLIEIAQLHDSKINVVHIDKNKDGKLNRKEETNKQLLQDILDGTDYEIRFLSATNVSDGINTFIENNDCDIIAFLNRKHLFFGSILSNPMVKEIGYDPKIPILELNDN
ncbi:universal stress protein [Allomuricauda sp. R78024]|uniref:universal stress protein n=1 Tax=Allomuricauda sp. R78024 TaxID=3093867 RepID=UPI0037C68708